MIKVRSDYHKTTFKKIAAAADELLDIRGTVAVDVDFLDESEICELNARTRQINRPTDVLSYPFIENAGEPFTKENFPYDYNARIGAVELGCIAICREYIEKAASEDQTAYIKDVYRAFTHGILHLMGFDHVTESQYERMHELENKIMKKAGVKL